MKNMYVYILTNHKHGTLYVGVTNNLARRFYEHKQDLIPGFTKKYGLKTLVRFELFHQSIDAIRREKQLKNWKRAWKIELIEKKNPDWKDLSGMLNIEGTLDAG